MASDQERVRQIEALRIELHRRMGGRYDPKQVAQLVNISQELDKLVVEVTRRQWSRSYMPSPGEGDAARRPGRRRRKKQ